MCFKSQCMTQSSRHIEHNNQGGGVAKLALKQKNPGPLHACRSTCTTGTSWGERRNTQPTNAKTLSPVIGIDEHRKVHLNQGDILRRWWREYWKWQQTIHHCGLKHYTEATVDSYLSYTYIYIYIYHKAGLLPAEANVCFEESFVIGSAQWFS